jgi:hypothetical protein
MYPTQKILIEFDKSGAEWICVAYLSGDGNMLSVVEEEKDPHLITGSLITGVPEHIVLKEHELVGDATDPNEVAERRGDIDSIAQERGWFLPRSMSIRQAGKKSNHGLNYNVKYKTFALVNEIQEAEARKIIQLYRTRAYPGIPMWQDSIKSELQNNNKTLTNCFGRVRRFYDPPGEELWDKAFAFKPQSTVFDICRKGMVHVYNSEEMCCREAELMSHTHDSNTYQFPLQDLRLLEAFCYNTIHKYMNPICHYNGRDFQINTTAKMGYDLSNMVKFSPDLEDIKRALDELNVKAPSS